MVNRICKNCKWWQDYTRRVWARISDFEGDRGGSVELRLCKYIAPPSIRDTDVMYTDKDYCCGEFEEKNNG